MVEIEEKEPINSEQNAATVSNCDDEATTTTTTKTSKTIRLVVQNLQKWEHLASDLIVEYDPDILLAQEINLSSENEAFFGKNGKSKNVASAVSRWGYGTAIYCNWIGSLASRLEFRSRENV